MRVLEETFQGSAVRQRVLYAQNASGENDGKGEIRARCVTPAHFLRGRYRDEFLSDSSMVASLWMWHQVHLDGDERKGKKIKEKKETRSSSPRSSRRLQRYIHVGVRRRTSSQELRVTLNGESLALNAKKAVAIAAWLIITSGRQSRWVHICLCSFLYVSC